MQHLRRFLQRVNNLLEKGFRRQTYTELYSWGAMTREEYLRLMDDEDNESS